MSGSLIVPQESKEKTINKDGKRPTCQEDVREAHFFINGKESCCSHKNSWDIHKGGPSKIVEDETEHPDKRSEDTLLHHPDLLHSSQSIVIRDQKDQNEEGREKDSEGGHERA